MFEVQEKERRELARELHDQTGQYLTALRLILSRAQKKASGETVPLLDEAFGLVGELVAQVRSMSLDLRPPMLDDMGLLHTLIWHFERYTTQTGIQVDFKHIGLDRKLPPEINTAAYRVIQEALTNVARHAGVNRVDVRIKADRDLIVTISDEGKGFDTEAFPKASNGLSGMKERVLLVGGQLTVETALKQGTRVIAEFPLTAVQQSEDHVATTDTGYDWTL